MTDISVFSNHPNIATTHIYKDEFYDSYHINIVFTAEFIEIINWVKKHKLELEKEKKLRETNPAIKELYDSYKTLVDLTI